ncbi:MAG TPA: hypothetical protein ENJ87_02375 [Gammaproteobacteria bacterium]|nr:hypothetical protein [Gammaproteobacteria bacterium]
MESLRWILLAAGAVFVLVIYVLGRSRRRRKHATIDELEDDLPEFSANNLDDVDEGVGEVRIITGAGPRVEDTALEEAATIKSQESRMPSDFIVLYILPKNDPNGKNLLAGAQINSSAQAMGLSFGEMNIFHYKPENRCVFSLANMLEPGSFDADTIHDLKTSGLTVFMKIGGMDPLDDLTEMLQRSYQLAGLLDARLCSHKRETLTEQDAENYRKQVQDFINGETSELSTET